MKRLTSTILASSFSLLALLVAGCPSESLQLGANGDSGAPDATGGRPTGGLPGTGGVLGTGGMFGSGGTGLPGTGSSGGYAGGAAGTPRTAGMPGAGGTPGLPDIGGTVGHTGGTAGGYSGTAGSYSGTAGSNGATGEWCGGETLTGEALVRCQAGNFCDLVFGFCAHANLGTCTRVPSGCTTEWKPVCGCDGLTYGNECARLQAGVSKASDGACATGTGGPRGAGGAAGAAGSGGVGGAGGTAGMPGAGGTAGYTGGMDGGYSGTAGSNGATGEWCGGQTLTGEVAVRCQAGNFCDLVFGFCADANLGTCTRVPSGCTTEWKPVCGCDGLTYGNECARLQAGVSKASDGACATGTGGPRGAAEPLARPAAVARPR